MRLTDPAPRDETPVCRLCGSDRISKPSDREHLECEDCGQGQGSELVPRWRWEKAERILDGED